MTEKRPEILVRVVAPIVLVLGMGAAVALFSRGQAPVPTPRGGAPSNADAMTVAHEAAGVQVDQDPDQVRALFEERVRKLEEQLREGPGDRQLVLTLARLLHDGHRSDEAVGRYRQAIAMDPADPQPYYDLAAIHAESSDWPSAAAALQDLLDLAPNDAIALYDMGAIRANEGRIADARQSFEAARAVTTDGALLARISEALARLGMS
jgi:tetratricopeptide (TPR) repeat protein